MRTLFTGWRALSAACALAFTATSASAQVVPAGDDGWMTVRKLGTTGTTVDLSMTPLPADFFYPGSDPFTGSFALKGEELPSFPPGALAGADTIVERLADTPPLLPGSTATVPIEIRALNLVSCEPIVVTGTNADEDWNVRVSLSSAAPQMPGMNAISGWQPMYHRE